MKWLPWISLSDTHIGYHTDVPVTGTAGERLRPAFDEDLSRRGTRGVEPFQESREGDDRDIPEALRK
jgi:hypothetical protein